MPPESFKEHLRLMMDIMVLAFKTDSTRISSFLMAHDGSTRNFQEIGVPDGHHNISHNQGRKENLDRLAKIDRFYMGQLACFPDRRAAENLTSEPFSTCRAGVPRFRSFAAHAAAISKTTRG